MTVWYKYKQKIININYVSLVSSLDRVSDCNMALADYRGRALLTRLTHILSMNDIMPIPQLSLNLTQKSIEDFFNQHVPLNINLKSTCTNLNIFLDRIYLLATWLPLLESLAFGAEDNCNRFHMEIFVSFINLHSIYLEENE